MEVFVKTILKDLHSDPSSVRLELRDWELDKACAQLDEMALRLENDKQMLIEEVHRLQDIIEKSDHTEARQLKHLTQELVNKIQSTISHHVPMWKNSVLFALGIQGRPQALRKINSDLTASILHMLQEYREIKRC